MNEWKHEKAFWRKYFDRSSKWNYIPYVVTFPCLLRSLPSSTKGWSFGTATNECCWNRKWVRRKAPSMYIFREILPWYTIYVTRPHSWVFGVHPVGLPQVRLPLLFSLFLVLRKVFSNVFLVLSSSLCILPRSLIRSITAAHPGPWPIRIMFLALDNLWGMYEWDKGYYISV